MGSASSGGRVAPCAIAAEMLVSQRNPRFCFRAFLSSVSCRKFHDDYTADFPSAGNETSVAEDLSEISR